MRDALHPVARNLVMTVTGLYCQVSATRMRERLMHYH